MCWIVWQAPIGSETPIKVKVKVKVKEDDDRADTIDDDIQLVFSLVPMF